MSDFGLKLESHYARLPEGLLYHACRQRRWAKAPPGSCQCKTPRRCLDLDPAVFRDPRFVGVSAGHRPLEGFKPLAMVYSGHQFGVWAGQLGDGRALLIGQVRNRKGEFWDIQLKGAGRTPYSRFGDGRAVMRSTIREYLCSEAMAALGIPTSRALAIVATGETVRRETARARRGADAAGAQPCALRPFRAFLPSRPERPSAALADYVIARIFHRICRRLCRLVRRGGETHRRADRPMAGGGLCPWRDEHRQYVHPGPDHGLWPLRLSWMPMIPTFVCNHSDETGPLQPSSTSR